MRKRRFARYTGRNSLLHRYLISYTSLALIGCLFAGMLLLFSSAREIESTVQRGKSERMKIAVSYLDALDEAIRDVAARIKLDPSYDTDYLEKSVLNERNLIESFSKYRNYSPLFGDYCLYYPETNVVYTDTTKCSSFETFCKYVLHTNRAEMLREEWTTLEQWIDSEFLPGKFVYVKPIIRRTKLALLIFIIDQTNTETILSSNVGMESGTLHIRLASTDTTASETALLTERATFCLSIDSDAPFDHIRDYLTRCVGILLGVMTLLTLIAIYAAYQNYLPIRRLTYQYIPSTLAANRSELDEIEETLLTVLHDRSQSQRQVQKILDQLHDQQLILRQYFADELLNGHVSAVMQHSLQMAGVNFSRKYSMLFLIDPSNTVDVDKINAVMEEVSDENLSLFCTELPETPKIITFANFHESDSAMYAMEIIGSIFENASSIQCSQVASDVSQLSSAWLSLNGAAPADHLEELLKRTADDIRHGNIESSLNQLRMLLSPQQPQFDAEKRGVYLAIIRTLCSIAAENHVILSAECIQNMLLAQSSQQFLNVVTPVVYEIASVVCQEIDDADARRLIDCIDQNLGSHELSREWVAATCRMSEHMVGKIFRNVIKMSYTDYVRIRRLNKAKDLLVQTDMTVNAIGSSLGYVNISYFIRAFKEYVGTTPAMYRAEGKIRT